MNKIFYRSAVFVGAVLLAACAAPPAEVAPPSAGAPAEARVAPANTIVAVKTDTVGLDADAAYWTDAPLLTVTTKPTVPDEPDGADLLIQAAYDSQNVAFRLEWADPTNTNIANPWVWDGTAFTRRTGEHEDRMGVIFPIENIPDFASKGCTAACHNQDENVEKWWMGVENADEHLDLWQWKAAQTNPLGQTDDQWLNTLEDPEDIESATFPDAMESTGNLTNRNEAQDAPLYMHGADLTATYIMTGEQVDVDTTNMPAGTIIPGTVLNPFAGSRGDVQANGVWADGKWVVVLMRALDTGHDDDVVFTPPKSYPVGIAIFDHVDLHEHTTTPDVLTLTWE